MQHAGYQKEMSQGPKMNFSNGASLWLGLKCFTQSSASGINCSVVSCASLLFSYKCHYEDVIAILLYY